MMPALGHETALAELASELSPSGRAGAERGAEMGSGGARPQDAPENSQLADLFLDLDGEVDAFEGHAIAPPAKRGPGRPPGSLNRSTKQLQAWLYARGYRDPIEFLAALYTADTRDLAAQLKGKPVESVTFEEAEAVAKLQKGAAGELLPYLHQKTPMQVEHQGDAARPLILMFDGAPGAVAVGTGAVAMSVHEAERNQGDSARVIEGSHGAGSHEGGQAADVADES